MNRLVLWVACAAALALLVSPALASEVSQGKCVKFEEAGMLITLEEYDLNFTKEHPYGQPTGTKSVYNASKAEIGAPPKPGDILRIAYDVKGTERVAVKVMNITRQDLMKK
jgi:hypothetical protein